MNDIVHPSQKIYFGAPGTGKSHEVSKDIEDCQRVVRVTIHPEYTYADFVGQFLPVSSGDGKLEFPFVEGPLTHALRLAFEDRASRVYLVLEELSRGNVSAVFGDTFQLLDRDEFGESKYPIYNKMISESIVESEESLRHDRDHQVVFPANLNILATVNLNDQNVAPMDTAFKRRFDWRYIDSLPAVKDDGTVDTVLNNPAIRVRTPNSVVKTNWLTFYTSLNEFIVDRKNGLARNEDRQVGQFFVTFPRSLVAESQLKDGREEEALDTVHCILQENLLQYLWQDVEGQGAGVRGVSLFRDEVSSFGTLYYNFESKPVFSDGFLDVLQKRTASSPFPYGG